MEFVRSKIRIVRQKNRVPEIIHKRRWKTLMVLCLSLMIVMIGNTALNVALPSLARDLQADNSQLQWLVDAYSLVFAGMLFTMGAIGDRYGRKGILQAGLVLFAGGSLYAALVAETANQLIGARAVMGLAGAMIMPATLSILTNIFSAKERPKAVGIWAGVSGGGVAFGPLLTGFILEHFSWHAVFLLNAPLIALALLAGVFLIPRTADPDHTNLDPVGAILSIIGLVSIVYAIIEAPHAGWLSAQTLLLGVGGLVAVGLFTLWELKNKQPMLDVRLLKKPAFGVSALVLTIVFFALMGVFFNMSQLLQLVFGYTPMQAAVRMLPVAFTMMLCAPQSPKMVEKFGKRRTVAAGMFVVALGAFLLSRISADTPYLLFAACMVIMSFGMSFAMSPTTDLLMSSVPRNRAGMGSAMNDTTRELGGALGIAVLGSLLASQYANKIVVASAQLPEAARAVAEQSLAGALMVAQQMGTAGTQFADMAKDAWMSGYHFSLTISAILIAIAATIAIKLLPDKSADYIPEEGGIEASELEKK